MIVSHCITFYDSRYANETHTLILATHAMSWLSAEYWRFDRNQMQKDMFFERYSRGEEIEESLDADHVDELLRIGRC